MTNLLHVDIEGGFGGSSISLYNLVKLLDKKKFKCHTIVKIKGPIYQKYKSENIDVIHLSNIYSFIPKPQGVNNFKLFLYSLKDIFKLPIGIIEIIKIIKQKKIDVIHLNFEGLFLMGFFLKLFTGKKIVTHFRSTLPKESFFHDLICKLIIFISDKIIFINNYERKKFLSKFKKVQSCFTIYNFSSINFKKKKIKRKGIVYFGNISFFKGVDKLIDVAKALNELNIKEKIFIYGLPRGELKFFERFKSKIKKEKLKNIKIMGRSNNPEKIIKRSLLLLRPSRWDDPWGRDIIDSIHALTPCITSGSSNELVKNGYNGYLVKDFEPKKVSFIIHRILIKNKNMWKKLSMNQEKILKLKLKKIDRIKKIEKVFNIK